MTTESIDISGFGGRYEAACQVMLQRGLEWITKHPDFNIGKAYRQFKGVTGICISDEELSKDLDKYICSELDPSGAMHHAVIFHLARIQEIGYDRWIAMAVSSGQGVVQIDLIQIRETLADLNLTY
jgi:hypothetical protein